jgi:O-antigen ligase
VGAELGLPGLLLFVGLLAGGFGALRQVTRRRDAGAAPRERDLAQALTASLLGFVVGAVFLSLAYSEMLYALLALAAGLCKVAVPGRSRIRPSR